MSDQQPWPSAPPPPEGYGYGYGMAEEVRPELEIAPPDQQSRLTVLLRLLLLIPQIIALFFLYIAAFFVTVVGWFAALFTGRLPAGIADFLTGFLGYHTRVTAYGMLLVDKYPPFSFSAPGHPVQVTVQPGELNRLAVLFRYFLMIPASFIDGILFGGWYVVSWIIWLVTLILGRMPGFVWNASAAVLRFQMRTQAYVTMLTPAYPWNAMLGDGPLPQGQPIRGTRPLLMDGAAKALLVVFAIIGFFGDVSYNAWWNNR